MTWRAGVDAVSFGGTKNGLMGGREPVGLLRPPAQSWELELRRKRAGAPLQSKHAPSAAQMVRLPSTDGLC
jgi:threonine aldolase